MFHFRLLNVGKVPNIGSHGQESQAKPKMKCKRASRSLKKDSLISIDGPGESAKMYN